MRITQGQFSFLPDLTDEEIRAQVDYALSRGWALSVEWTDDPHPRTATGTCGAFLCFKLKMALRFCLK
jgi:ribulose-bisphosphate carboxylase small chain